jgi:hypothetical protein
VAACSRAESSRSKANSAVGDPIGVRDERGKAVAQGLAEYGSDEIAADQGHADRGAPGAARLRATLGGDPSRPAGVALTLAVTGGTGFVGGR